MIDLIERPAWMARAGCRGVDPELFFPERGEPGSKAKAVCWTLCPVRAECLAYALDNGEKFGVWGGASERERRRMRRQRPLAVRICLWGPCQLAFTPTTGAQVYHSPACAAAAASARKVPSRRVG